MTQDSGLESLRFVRIPAGEFMMGSPRNERGRDNDERQHRVRITSPFCMSATEVTQEQYEALIGTNPSHFKGAQNPVDEASWHDATEFCRRLSEKTGKTVRLPTEAEWEYACRAGTTTPFHTGNTISTDQANYDGNYAYAGGHKGTHSKRTMPVRSFAPNAWGLFDMHGNVWEWCQDWYGAGYYGKSPAVDPQGPANGMSRVVRGGSWHNPPIFARSAARFYYVPSFAFAVNGLRVVVTAE